MHLSICIPTHTGRLATLRELLENLLAEIVGGDLQPWVEICVSDNASTDGTAAMVGAYVERFPGLITYQRLPVNTGIRNFFTVIAMSRGTHAWLMGSDDAVLPGAIHRVLAAIKSDPEVPGFTFNKLNFSRDLETLIGPDHDQVLPGHPEQSRLMEGREQVARNLFAAYFFISAHVFRRSDWDTLVNEIGLERVLRFQHFPHTLLYTEMAARGKGWRWISDYCVIQRLENFSFMTEVSQRLLDYAELHTGDLAQIATVVCGKSGNTHQEVMRRIFFLYWNPWYVLRYIADSAITPAERVRARTLCQTWFRDLPVFWITTFPILCLPGPVARGIVNGFLGLRRYLISTPRLSPLRVFGQRLFHTALFLLNVQRSRDRTWSVERELAENFRQARKRWGTSVPHQI